jgi:hypothetical protein
VARKYKIMGVNAARGEGTSGKSGEAKTPSGGTTFLSRMKKIQTPRRRLLITFLDEKPATVKMRQSDQNLGSLAAKIQPVQPQRI